VIGIGYATRIYLAVDATDMRKSFEGLSGLVREKLREDPLSGHLFLFCNRPRTRLKVLYWDGNGLWVCAKRLERGRFSWPVSLGDAAAGGAAVTISQEDLSMLIGGIEMARTERKRWWRRELQES
jgi:transposase